MNSGRIAFLVGAATCAFAGAIILSDRSRRRPSRPPVEELAQELKQAWAGRHTP